MAWICIRLDGGLVQKAQPELAGDTPPEQMDPTQQPQSMPVEGAPEAVMQLLGEGHRVTVVTQRFQAMPESEKFRASQEIEQELQSFGFPPELEIWTGSYMPAADLFIGPNEVTFDNDWGLALAQAQMMLEERGLAAAPQPIDQNPDVQEGAEDVEQEPSAEGGAM